MSIQSARDFIAAMKADEEFARQVAACQDADALKSLMKANGFDFTVDEIFRAMGQLSNNQLAEVTAGYGFNPMQVLTNDMIALLSSRVR